MLLPRSMNRKKKLFTDDCFFLDGICFLAPQDVKEAAYKGLGDPILEYGSSVWDPHYEGLIDDLEKVQKRAARFVPRNYTYKKGSMTVLKTKTGIPAKKTEG